MYCLDFGGGSLAAWPDCRMSARWPAGCSRSWCAARLPWSAGVLTRAGAHAAGVGSLAEWRERVGAGAVAGDGFGDVILVVDGWGALAESSSPSRRRSRSLAARGLNYGIHLVLAARRWPEIRPALKDLIGTRIELRLGDPLDSDVNASLAAGVPENRPGRGLSLDRLHLLTAVPRIDGRPTADGLAAATADLVDAVAARWPGPPGAAGDSRRA